MRQTLKPTLRPLCVTLLASLLCVSSAQAFNFDPLDLFGAYQNKGPVTFDAPITEFQQPLDITPAVLNYTKLPIASVQMNNAIKIILTASASQTATQIGKTSLDLVNIRALYALHLGRAFWTNDEGLTEMGQALQQALNEMVEAHGFSLNYYLTTDVTERMAQKDLQSLAELDVLLTQGYMLFIKDLTTGRINPKDPSQGLTDIEMRKNNAPALEILNAIVKTPDTLIDGMYNLVPKTIGYRALTESLMKLQLGRDAGGWINFSADRPLIRPGMSHANIVAIRQRLADLGYLPKEFRKNRSIQYDQETLQAVIRFQQLNFLGADGVIGAGTYKAMDFTIDKAINQIRANLEKWRLLPRTFPNRYLFVDMGRQELDIIENNLLVDRMRVIVGRDLHGTPTMTDQVSQIILSPYWYLPNSIIINETIPQITSNPDYLNRTHIRILNDQGEIDATRVNWSQYTLQNPPPYLFRQDSGPTNSLGLVKFELNNAHAIYMHDTDNHNLFNESIRYLSHGCIRLERPFDLAAYLLRDKGYQANQLEDEARRPDVHAEKVAVTPISVYIFGTTTVSYPDGIITLGADVFGQDDRIIKALDQMANPTTAALAVAPK